MIFKASWAIIDAIFINPLKTAFDLFISAPGKIYSGLADAFSSAWDFVDSIFISPVVEFFDGLTFDNILDGITSAFSSAWDFLS